MYPTAFDNLSKPSPATIRGSVGGLSPANTVASLIQSLQLVEYHLGLFPAVVTFTANFSTDTFTATAHGLANNDIVNVSNQSGALPTGLAVNVPYYVIGSTTNTFQLSATRAGSAINITDNGSGTNSFQRVFSESKFLVGGAGTFSDYSKAVPAGVVVGTTDSQTLSNKTITAPTITNATISQDAVTGFTSANNGSVYGITVTSSAIQSSAAFADSVILPKALLTGTGSTWAMQSWNPTFAGWTIGSGGSAGTTAKYIQIGKIVHFYVTSTLGTSGQSVGTNPTFSLPITASAAQAAPGDLPIASLTGNPAGTNYSGVAWCASTTTALMIFQNASATYLTTAGATATVPNTWASGNHFSAHGWYEAA